MTLRLGGCALAFSQAPALSGGPDGRGSFNGRLGCPAAAPTFGSAANLALGKTKKRARRHNIDVSSYGEPRAVSSQGLPSIYLEEEKDKALLIANNYTPQDEKSVDWPVHKWRGDHEHMQRDWFPPDFFFGASTSAFQIEGATNQKKYGRGPSIWDTFVKTQPDKIADHGNADTAIEGYLRYKEDVGIMKELNLNAYRFSISWSRILPTGRRSGGINEAGVEYYQMLINDLKAKGVEPFVTLFHWDLPQALEDQYTGFLSPLIVDDFRDYADICFKLFGDRVKHWITFNEPSIFCKFGCGSGEIAPGRTSKEGPYIVAHHLLLAHAAAVDQYRKHYKGFQRGKIGITLESSWYLPLNDSNADKEAVSRILDFDLGWYMDPLTNGSYPFIMRALLGNRLPSFTTQQSELLRGSFDFIGLNYYSSSYASGNIVLGQDSSFDSDSYVWTTDTRDGKPIGDPTTTWICVCPWGIRDLLKYIKEKYKDPIIYITENGFGYNEEDPKSGKPESLHDHGRTDYLKKHLYNVGLAGSEGVRVKGYLLWSLFDNFEWGSGYTVRYGIVHIDYKNLSRHWKDSAKWYRMFLRHPISDGPIFSGTPISGELSNSDSELKNFHHELRDKVIHANKI